MRTIRTVGDLVSPLGGSINAANVIMQLAVPGVGQGVIESAVHSGRADLHPVKRARTTTTYLAVAVFGNEDDRAYVREAVRRIHARVVSGPDSVTPYSANSPKLQLWVAVCLLKYFVDQYEYLHGPLTDAEYERVLRDGATLGTTLNVRPGAWPVTREEYDSVWRAGLHEVSMTDEVRTYLAALADLRFLEVRLGRAGYAIHRVLGRPFRLVTRGALPPEFRAVMEFEWSSDDQRAFARYLRLLRAVHRLTPGLWSIPWKAYLVDLRLRRRLGLPVF